MEPTLNTVHRLSGSGVRRFSTTLGALRDNLANTGRGRKQIVAVVVDAAISVVTLWAAWSLRFGMPFSDFRATWHLFLMLPAFTVLIFAGLGIYRWVIRSTNRRLFGQLLKGSLASSLLLVLIAYLLPPDRVSPRSLFAIYGALLFVAVYGVRMFWQSLFDAGRGGEPVAIYGAGSGGQQLADMLAGGGGFRPVVFIDDDPRRAGTTVGGLPVELGTNPDLRARLKRRDVERVVLAMPSLGSEAYREVLERAEGLGLDVKTMPSVTELMAGRARIDDVRDIDILDVLGRSEVAPDAALMAARVTGRVVMVTGGGGSIGSELCRQIVRLGPTRLVVLDNSEANLYALGEELPGLVPGLPPGSMGGATPGSEGVPSLVLRLGTVLDAAQVRRLIREHDVDTIFHAAAYKHVPIVESQPEQGVRVNVFGTRTVLDAACAAGVSDFVLISTDKAVRPANAMGATKRVAELLLQARAREPGTRTRVSMVRFGNVLNSSGSVVPKFKRQIESGGPVTLTHPDITRYFMTIPEAAQLVLQASAAARGGEVFVLDMGEPIRIADLARTMVRLSGRALREDTDRVEDIEIRIGGLRPGEKMYEELFIGEGHRPTSVPKIFSADEVCLSGHELERWLEALEAAIEHDDPAGLRAMLMALVAEAQRESVPDRAADGVQDVPDDDRDDATVRLPTRAAGPTPVHRAVTASRSLSAPDALALE